MAKKKNVYIFRTPPFQKRDHLHGAGEHFCGHFYRADLLCWWSYGEGGAILGSLGVTGIVFALCGLVSGLTSFREKHILYTFSKAGSIVSSVALVLWIFVILLGVS